MTTRAEMADKLEAFAQEYVANAFNGAAAARAVGYTSSNAKRYAIELLAREDVQQRVEEIKREYFNRLHMDRDEVLGRLAMVARADPAHCIDDNGQLKSAHDIDPEVRAAIDTFEPGKRVTFASRMAALQTLAKYHRLSGDVFEMPIGGEKDAEDVDVIEVARKVAFVLAMAEREQKKLLEAKL